MPRTSRGRFLKLDALRMGVPEQYATIKGNVKHVVEIVFDRERGGLVTQHRQQTLDGDDLWVSAWQCGEDVALAREHFRREAHELGGRV